MEHIDLNTNILKNLKDFLHKNHIEVYVGGDTFRQGTNLVKNNSGVLLVLYYYIEKRNENIYFQGFDRYIVFEDLEKIVYKALIDSDIVGKDYDIINRSSFSIDESINLEYNLDLISSNSLNDICDNLKIFYKRKAFPFFEKWNNLNVLYEFIKDKEGREELDAILGQFWAFKKAAILRLCNDSKYQEYMDDFVERRALILEKRPDSIDVQRYYKAATELKAVLDQTEPVYNV